MRSTTGRRRTTGCRGCSTSPRCARTSTEEHVVLAEDVRVALCDGELAGYAFAEYIPSEVRLERCYVWGEVDPIHRGVGVGRALLGWGIERATARLRASVNDVPKYIRVNRFDYVEPAHRLYRRMGFTPARYFDELLRPLDELPVRRRAPRRDDRAVARRS